MTRLRPKPKYSLYMPSLRMPSNVPYGPAEDTWLLEDSLMRAENVGRSAEVGCGTGYITKILAEKSVEVVAIEKDAESAYLARENLRRVLSNVHIIIADGLSPIHTSAKLDLIVSNPPYLPLDDEFYDPAIHGGFKQNLKPHSDTILVLGIRISLSVPSP